MNYSWRNRFNYKNQHYVILKHVFFQIFKILKRIIIYSIVLILAKILHKWTELRIIGTRELLKKIGTEVFYFVINPALLMGAGFAFISSSVRLEELSTRSGIEILSLYGLLNYENAAEFSNHLHGFLNEYSLIGPLFFIGIFVLCIRRYRQLSDLPHSEFRIMKALSLAFFEGCFLAVVLLGGSISDIATIFPIAIIDWNLVWVITVLAMVISPLRGWLAESMECWVENNLRR